MQLLPEWLFGTQAPNTTTVLFAMIIVVIVGANWRALRGFRWTCLIVALISGWIVGVKNFVYETVVDNPNRETDAEALTINADALAWVGFAQIMVAALYAMVIVMLMRDRLERWHGLTMLLFAAAFASAWAAVASTEWAHTFYVRAQNNGIGDYQPFSQLLHIALVLIIGIMTLFAMGYWWRHNRGPRLHQGTMPA